ncbi:MAG: DUF4397 domain-containing protein [Woeseiaceae bacterium]|nr:DUF4397 domain-containing protein [Woeseiaceae bacterium]
MRQGLLLVLAGLLSACGGSTNFPTPTGKGTVRAINAITDGPEIAFYIEERFQESINFKSGGGSTQWDDFEYTFNFEANFFDQAESVRIASPLLKIDAERDYTLVVTGDVANPSVTIWEQAERVFDGTETVFELRFANLSPSAGSVDVYFAAPGTPPVLGEQQGTISFGEIIDAADFAEGEYVLTVTAAGNPADVLFQSTDSTFVPGNASIAILFDGDALDTSPFDVRVLNTLGGGGQLADARFGPTVRFIQASITLPAADIYNDDTLTNVLLANHQFGDVSDNFEFVIGTTPLNYTPAGNPGAILEESGITAAAGTRYNFVMVGNDDDRIGAEYVPNLRSVSTEARVEVYHAADNHPAVDIYLVPRGDTFTIDDRIVNGLDFAFRTVLRRDAGSFDIYLTPEDEDTIIAGPLELDAVLGDVFEVFVFDTVDPATAELRVLPSL